jgi:hypothetical protein
MTFDERLAAIRASMIDGIYSLRVGLSDGHDHAIVSAVIAVHARGNDVLWSRPGVAR